MKEEIQQLQEKIVKGIKTFEQSLHRILDIKIRMVYPYVLLLNPVPHDEACIKHKLLVNQFGKQSEYSAYANTKDDASLIFPKAGAYFYSYDLAAGLPEILDFLPDDGARWFVYNIHIKHYFRTEEDAVLARLLL